MGGLNGYFCAAGNPLRYSDPHGLWTAPLLRAAAALLLPPLAELLPEDKCHWWKSPRFYGELAAAMFGGGKAGKVGKGKITNSGKAIIANEAGGTIKLLPGPGNTLTPANGIGANSIFKIDKSQLGKKVGKHVEDFGGSAKNATDRQMVLNRVNEAGKSPDKIIPGTFAGQGPNGTRGDVFFRIKGEDVVVTKPNGVFVTILKGGVSNTSVKNALRGNH